MQTEGAIVAEVVLLFRWRERELNYIERKICVIPALGLLVSKKRVGDLRL